MDPPSRCSNRRSSPSLNLPSAIEDIERCDFSSVSKLDDPNLAVDKLYELISPILVTNTIYRTIPSKLKIIKPWITAGLLRCIRNRDSMHKKVNKDPHNSILKLTYLRYRNFCNNLLKKLKVTHEEKAYLDAKNNAKKLWSAVRNILDSNKKTLPPIDLLKLADDPVSSVNLVNGFFAGVGRNLANNIPQSLNKATTGPCSTFTMLNSMGLLETDEEQVDAIIKDLRVDSASGWDGIPPKLLKSTSHKLIPPITHICNLALSTGIFPKLLKKAIVHPIFKTGDRGSVNNYRPISVLPSISKVLERVIYKNLLKYLTKYKIIAENQYGFKKGVSTEDAVSALLDAVVNKIDNKLKCIGIFLDLSKAFDTVSVPILLNKLERIGIRGTAFKLLHSFLSDRTQCVKVGEYISGEEVLDYGVPQGSLLSPILFQIYVNDLCLLALPSTQIIAYADDTVLLSSGPDWKSAKDAAERSLSQVMVWLGNNSLTLNIAKTNFMAFVPKSSTHLSHLSLQIKAHVCDDSARNVTCSCQIVSGVSSVKYLGLFLDSCLNWRTHIESLAARTRKLLYVFKKLRTSAHTKILKMVYIGLCESILGYCIVAWGGAAKTIIIQAERAQRAVIKVLLGKPFRYPTQRLYSDFKAHTVRQLYIIRTVLRIHKTTPPNKNQSPTIRRRPKPVCPRIYTNTTFARRHYRYLGALIYNKLHTTLKIHNLSMFQCKSKVKEYLFTLNYDDTERLLNT